MPLEQSSATQFSKSCNKKTEDNMQLYQGDLLESVEILSTTLEISREITFNLAMKMKMMTTAIALSFPRMISTLVEESVET